MIPRHVLAAPFQNDFQNITWDYHLIFKTIDVPPPSAAPNSTIHSIYSPSVIKYNGKFFMLFGVAVNCNIYRDSIALATSPDGLNWTFDKFLIEPDPLTCQLNWGSWPIGMQYQTNSPEINIIKDNGYDRFLVLFDSVLWKSPVDNQSMTSPVECNNIGVAIFDTDFNLLFRNNKYLATDEQNCKKTIEGFKSPAFQWLSPVHAKLWFDKLGHPGHTSITSLTQLPYPPTPTYDSFVGGDLNFPPLSYTNDLVLYGWGELGPTITARSRVKGDAWSSPWTFLPRSGQSWDLDRQGSPSLYLDKESCTLKLYYSGNAGYDASTVDNQRLAIGVAIPKGDHQFHFDNCTTSSSMPGDLNGDGKVNVYDFVKLLNGFNTIYSADDFSTLLLNYGKQI